MNLTQCSNSSVSLEKTNHGFITAKEEPETVIKHNTSEFPDLINRNPREASGSLQSEPDQDKITLFVKSLLNGAKFPIEDETENEEHRKSIESFEENSQIADKSKSVPCDVNNLNCNDKSGMQTFKKTSQLNTYEESHRIREHCNVKDRKERREEKKPLQTVKKEEAVEHDLLNKKDPVNEIAESKLYLLELFKFLFLNRTPIISHFFYFLVNLR